MWRRWFASTEQTDGVYRTIIRSAESKDGKAWQLLDEPALAGAAGAWDSSVSDPTVIFDPHTRRYVMFYAGSSDTQGAENSSIGVAFSLDGKTFSRLASEESPYAKSGLILPIEQVFANDQLVKTGKLGEPKVVRNHGDYQMWFYKVGLDKDGNVASAGVTCARSRDGINWQTDNQDALTLQFTDNHVSSGCLSRKLHNLSTTYSECSM